MAGLKRTPVDRPSGADLVRAISQETASLPPTIRQPEPPASPPPVVFEHTTSRAGEGTRVPMPSPMPASSTATEQINFRGSPELARILARLAAEQGSIRLVIARLLREAGHAVPDADLLPPPGRRRLG